MSKSSIRDPHTRPPGYWDRADGVLRDPSQVIVPKGARGEHHHGLPRYAKAKPPYYSDGRFVSKIARIGAEIF